MPSPEPNDGEVLFGLFVAIAMSVFIGWLCRLIMEVW